MIKTVLLLTAHEYGCHIVVKFNTYYVLHMVFMFNSPQRFARY